MIRNVLLIRVGMALFAAMLVVGLGCSVAAARPETAIITLQKGMDACDLALVEKHLDIDAVVKKGSAQVLADKEIAAEAAKHPALGLMFALGGNAAGNEALLSLLTAEAREYVEYGVQSGAFAGKEKAGHPPYQGLFSKAFRGKGKDKKSFGPVKILKQEKETAVIATTLTEGAKKRTYPLQLRLERHNAAWRVTELVNVADFIRQRKEKEGK